MELADIKKVREYIKPDDIITIVTDNQHLEYGQVADQIPLIWNDDDSMLYIMKVNTDTYNQHIRPMTLCCISYDVIQRIELSKSTNDALELVKDLSSKGLLDEKGKSFAMAQIARASKNANVSVMTTY